MTILWEFEEQRPKQVSAHGTTFQAIFSHPYGLRLVINNSWEMTGLVQPTFLVGTQNQGGGEGSGLVVFGPGGSDSTSHACNAALELDRGFSEGNFHLLI